MSCLSRLLGLVCAVVPGLIFLLFSALFFQRSPQLGWTTGLLYALASLITGVVCLYLGFGILFGRESREETVVLADVAPQVGPPPMVEPLQNVALPAESAEPVHPDRVATSPVPVVPSSASPITSPSVVDAPDSPEMRIRQLARTRPHWQVTAPQLAHLANLNLAVADVTARTMAQNGHAQIHTGPGGETIYVFDLADGHA